jgi:hypothetical protein
MGWIVLFVFAIILAVSLLGRGNLTGQATGSIIPISSGMVLSIVSAVLAIGVLVVAGFQEVKK